MRGFEKEDHPWTTSLGRQHSKRDFGMIHMQRSNALGGKAVLEIQGYVWSSRVCTIFLNERQA
jgi:hypothetical protein